MECIQGCSSLRPGIERSREHFAHVDWHKGGLKIPPQDTEEIQTNSPGRTVDFPSAETSNGARRCLTSDDTVALKVEVPGDLYILSLSPSLNDSYCFFFLSVRFPQVASVNCLVSLSTSLKRKSLSFSSLRPIATDHANPSIRKVQDDRCWLSNYSSVRGVRRLCPGFLV